MGKGKSPLYLIIFSVLFIVIFLVIASTFVIKEGRQAIVLQFGRPIRTIQQAGLHWKKPFIQEVRKIDMRILNWDGYAEQIQTGDDKYILVDTTARWKITDPLKFIQTLENQNGAKRRLDAIIDSATRDVVPAHNLVETVRNSNKIIDSIKAHRTKVKKKTKAKEIQGDVGSFTEEEVFGDIERVKIGREKLSLLILEKAKVELAVFGIELIDVQIRRIAYPESVENKVFARMISERQRIAEKIRSYGKGEQAKIEGKIEKDLQLIESRAYRTVQQIKGRAESRATRIYAKSLGQNPSFYDFTRKLEAYKVAFNEDTQFILSTDSDFLDMFQKGMHGVR